MSSVPVSPWLGLTLLTEGQAGGEVIFNEAVNRLEFFTHMSVKSIGDVTPVTQVDGDAYILGVTPTGVWAGHGNEVAYGEGGGWVFFTVNEGMRAWVQDDKDWRVYDGSSWQGANTISSLSNPPSSNYDQAEADEVYDKVQELLTELRTLGIIN